MIVAANGLTIGGFCCCPFFELLIETNESDCGGVKTVSLFSVYERAVCSSSKRNGLLGQTVRRLFADIYKLGVLFQGRMRSVP